MCDLGKGLLERMMHSDVEVHSGWLKMSKWSVGNGTQLTLGDGCTQTIDRRKARTVCGRKRASRVNYLLINISIN